jgi:hypothetical protein
MDTSSTTEKNKSAIHVQRVSRRPLRHVASAKKHDTSVIKLHRKNRINLATSMSQRKQQQSTSTSDIKSVVTVQNVSAENSLANDGNSTVDAVQPSSLFMDPSTYLNNSVKSTATWANNSMLEVVLFFPNLFSV